MATPTLEWLAVGLAALEKRMVRAEDAHRLLDTQHSDGLSTIAVRLSKLNERLQAFEAAYGPFGTHNETHNHVNQRIERIENARAREMEAGGIVAELRRRLDLAERVRLEDVREGGLLYNLGTSISRLAEKVEAKIERGEAHYWDRFDASGERIPRRPAVADNKTINMPWTPEEFLKLRAQDTSGVEADPTPIAPGHAWVDGYLVDVKRLTAERDALKVVSKACRERNEVLVAERDKAIADAATLAGANEGLRIEVERLKAELEATESSHRDEESRCRELLRERDALLEKVTP